MSFRRTGKKRKLSFRGMERKDQNIPLEILFFGLSVPFQRKKRGFERDLMSFSKDSLDSLERRLSKMFDERRDTICIGRVAP